MNQIGLIGLAVMGANLARNFASKDTKIAVYNRTYSRTQEVIEVWQEDKQIHPEYTGEIVGFEDLEAMVQSLERPRKLVLLVKSGQPVDDMITQLLPLLEKDDIIVDLGNSNWKDTQKRNEFLTQKGLNFVGSGVSGGEEGALKGPSMMPGGNKYAVDQILPLFEKIAADDFEGGKCVTNIGGGASGHFVKMVHNGIEYAIMQGIAEIYGLLKNEGYTNLEIQKVIDKANSGFESKESEEDSYSGLGSYLMEITSKILATKDGEGYLLDQIVGAAKAKGTGGWTVEAALEFGVYTPSIAAAVFARIGSAKNQEYNFTGKIESQESKYPDRETLEDVCIAGLEIIHLVSYYQGLDLITKANDEMNWEINLKEVIRIWQGGCIIRSNILIDLYEDWKDTIDFEELIPVTEFLRSFPDVTTPVTSSIADYMKNLVIEQLPTNMIQAQRDFFGAHTYKRIDKEGDFTGGWETI